MTEAELKDAGVMCLATRREMARTEHVRIEGIGDYAIETWPYRSDESKPLDEDEVHCVEFIVYQTYHTTDLKGVERIEYQDKNSMSSPAPVESLDDAEMYLHGGVKWDGCVNYTPHGAPLHACGIRSFIGELELWKSIYRACRPWMFATVYWEAP